MSNDGGTGEEPAVLRQRDLVQAMGRSFSQLVDDDSSVVEFDISSLVGYAEQATKIIHGDGSRASVGTPDDIDDIIEGLRAVMYVEGGGTWMSAHFTVNARGGVDADFNYEVEPAWSHELDPELYAQEMRKFPRSEERTPEWLRRKLRAAVRASGE